MDRCSRRRFLQGSLALAGLGLFAGCRLVPPQAQESVRPRRIGLLSPGPREAVTPIFIEPVLEALRELGYVEGQNIAIEYRWADQDDQFADLTAELMGLKVEVLLTRGTPAAVGAKRATSTIPIVAAAVADPVGTGLVASLAHPGGNVTGLSTLGSGTDSKRLELLKGVVPTATRVGILANPRNQAIGPRVKQLEVAAQALGIQLQLLWVGNPDEFTGAFEAATGGHAGALLVPSDAFTINHRTQVVDLAARARLPGFYEHREFTDVGGLVSYGPNFVALFRRSATYVDKILKGASPAELPVEQPTEFDFVINLKTAQALGLTIPQSVLLQATEIIQ